MTLRGPSAGFFSDAANRALRAEATPIDAYYHPSFWLDFSLEQLQMVKTHRRWVRRSIE